VLAALILLGLAVVRHQAFVERRTTLQELPVSVVAIVVIMGFYAFSTQRAGFDAAQTALVTALAVFTHSIYDLVRELLDQWVDQQIGPAALNTDDLRPGPETALEGTAWLAPARANNEQVGAIGLGPRVNRGAYPAEDLDLLVEAADTVGQLLQGEAVRIQKQQ